MNLYLVINTVVVNQSESQRLFYSTIKYYHRFSKIHTIFYNTLVKWGDMKLMLHVLMGVSSSLLQARGTFIPAHQEPKKLLLEWGLVLGPVIFGTLPW